LDCGHAGASGELKGCYQFMPDTWKDYATDVLGYVPPATDINQEYVAVKKAQEWLERGYTPEEIFLGWNAGWSAKKCSSGVNSQGVRYDSCQYVKMAIDHYENEIQS
jgi:hypothetical protein